MTFYVYRKGVGPIFGSRPNELVREFNDWKSAHDCVTANNEHWFGTYNYFMTDNPNLAGTYS